MKKATKLDSLNYIGIIIAILALSGVFAYSHLRGQIENMAVHTSLSGTELSYEVTKLNFCINHQLDECTDSAIQEWNTSNTSNQFSLKSYQELVEQSIDERRSALGY